MTIVLNSRLTTQTTGGKFIYLGYLSWVNASNTTHPNHPSQRNILPNGHSDECFGLWSNANPTNSPIGDINNADTTPAVLEYIANHPNNPYGLDTNTVPIAALGASLSYNTSVDFTNKAAGYYGFMYLVGDSNNDGVLAGECGDVECFEIEVLESFPDYTNITLNYCSDLVPSSINLQTALTNINPTLILGGNYAAVNPIPSSSLVGNTVSNITIPVTPGTYGYTYTLPISLLGAYHTPISGSCTQEVVNITIVVTAALEAGIGASAAVCN